MKIVQTFWAGSKNATNDLNITSGWKFPEYHWMSWTLSCLRLRKHYERVELFTDSLGKRILIDVLGLPYTKVHIVFDTSFQIPPELFALAKIKTYQLQNEPFIHVDGDVYIWKAFPETLSTASLIASNLEKDLFFNKEVLQAIHKHSFHIPPHLKGIHEHQSIYASNAGILGGTHLEFIQKYCKIAQSFINNNKDHLEKVTIGNLNWLIEQVSFFYLAQLEKIPISYLVKQPVMDPLYREFWQFSDIPFVPMIHPVGGCKREYYVLNHLAKRLRLEFPSFYYKVLHHCKKGNVLPKNSIYRFINTASDTSLKNEKRITSHPTTAQQKDILLPAFKTVFYRSLDIIKRFHTPAINNFSQLETLFETKEEIKSFQPIAEIFRLEKEKYAMLNALVQNVEKGTLYQTDIQRYENASSFFMNEDWMKRTLKIIDGVLLFEQTWNWELFTETNDDDNAKTLMNENKTNSLITLSPDVMTLGILEIRHEGMDAILLRLVDGHTIHDLGSAILDYFEDDITIDNKQYQQLLFDTIKRMAFENILEIQ